MSNAHSEIFCRRSKVAIRAQCVLVATTLLHSGAKFHSFLYNGSKTVRVNMESCYGGMSTRLKRRAVTEFLIARCSVTYVIFIFLPIYEFTSIKFQYKLFKCVQISA